jgi:hypothetical protein
VNAWVIGMLVAVGGVMLAALKADLQDAKVWQWLAEWTIEQAVQRLPRSQRNRWREEWLRHHADMPGRLLPLVRALGIYFRAGRWGRMLRGAPSRSQVLIARLRAAWQRLRSWPTARARARAQQLHPASIQAPAEVAQVTAVTTPDSVTAVTTPASATAMLLDASVVAVGLTRTVSGVYWEPKIMLWVPHRG